MPSTYQSTYRRAFPENALDELNPDFPDGAFVMA
jgi:hypothetical protein